MNPYDVNEVRGSWCVSLTCSDVYFGELHSAQNRIFPEPVFLAFQNRSENNKTYLDFYQIIFLAFIYKIYIYLDFCFFYFFYFWPSVDKCRKDQTPPSDRSDHRPLYCEAEYLAGCNLSRSGLSLCCT